MYWTCFMSDFSVSPSQYCYDSPVLICRPLGSRLSWPGKCVHFASSSACPRLTGKLQLHSLKSWTTRSRAKRLAHTHCLILYVWDSCLKELWYGSLLINLVLTSAWKQCTACCSTCILQQSGQMSQAPRLHGYRGTTKTGREVGVQFCQERVKQNSNINRSTHKDTNNSR